MTSHLAKVPTAPQVLLAEDNLAQARRLQYILESHGYRVVAAVNGRAALECARRERPALIISDILLPEMNGYDLCRQVKQDAQLGDVPVVLVTTLSDPHEVIRGLECGADNFILKPYETDQLLRRIQFVLANDHLRRAVTGPQPAGLEIVFRGQKQTITADRLQILNLLFSTYEAAMERNHELTSIRDELRRANQEVQQLTQQLEERVRARILEVERSHQQLGEAQPGVPRQPTATTEARVRSMRILVVDDDPMLSQSLRNTLQAEGHEVIVALGGRAGIDAFQAAQRGTGPGGPMGQLAPAGGSLASPSSASPSVGRPTGQPFDAVITDLGMPHVDGRQVARAIRAMSADVPIIMLTGWGQNLLADTTPPPEVNRLLNKPPRLSELRAVLAEFAPTYAVTPDQPPEANRRDPR
jgi:DNA-binding response OmpR family regulator